MWPSWPLSIIPISYSDLPPWSVPYPHVRLKSSDLANNLLHKALRLTSLEPRDAMGVTKPWTEAWQQLMSEMTTDLQEVFLRNISPDDCTGQFRFFSTILTSLPVSRDKENPSWEAVQRISRLSTTTMLRQLQAFQINVPVFGILFLGSKVSVHVDWWEESEANLVLP